MPDIDIAADTDLGQRAIEAMEGYLKSNAAQSYRRAEDWLIARSQIAGLRQIAANEPTKLGEFVEHQRAKAVARLEKTKQEERRKDLEAQIAFWELVRGLCEGKGQKFPWSLTQARDQALPASLHDDKYAPGAQLTREQQAARKEKGERRKRWQQDWELANYSAFFQRFCIHYLYEMTRRTTGE